MVSANLQSLFSELQFDFANLHNVFADLQFGFAILQEPFADLQFDFAILREPFVDLIFYFVKVIPRIVKKELLGLTSQEKNQLLVQTKQHLQTNRLKHDENR